MAIVGIVFPEIKSIYDDHDEILHNKNRHLSIVFRPKYTPYDEERYIH